MFRSLSCCMTQLLLRWTPWHCPVRDLSGSRGSIGAQNHDAPSTILNCWDYVFILVHHYLVIPCSAACSSWSYLKFTKGHLDTLQCIIVIIVVLLRYKDIHSIVSIVVLIHNYQKYWMYKLHHRYYCLLHYYYYRISHVWSESRESYSV